MEVIENDVHNESRARMEACNGSCARIEVRNRST